MRPKPSTLTIVFAVKSVVAEQQFQNDVIPEII